MKILQIYIVPNDVIFSDICFESDFWQTAHFLLKLVLIIKGQTKSSSAPHFQKQIPPVTGKKI